MDGLPEVAGRVLPTTLADFERRCRVYLREEQAKPSPDNALVALLCDGVRLAREAVDSAYFGQFRVGRETHQPGAGR